MYQSSPAPDRPQNIIDETSSQPRVVQPEPSGHKVGILTQFLIFVAATLVGVACFFFTYVAYMMFSDAGDFAGIIGFLPALLAFLFGLCATASIGMRVASSPPV